MDNVKQCEDVRFYYLYEITFTGSETDNIVEMSSVDQGKQCEAVRLLVFILMSLV